ncbi:type II toxin-antitoxin system VapC family toxin [Gracilimonas sediminicola]|uniref:type II toxin-antitoxin system VapC family toxin n=1 Tax=Gracilimonas sediminicola TaxID=2952158 RepID=UPI0038D4C126
MNYLLDTNILVYYITKPTLLSAFENKYQPFSNKNVALISIVTEAEMKSLAIQRGWGSKKMQQLEKLLSYFLRVPIQTEKQIKVYAEMDAYSKHKDPVRNYPDGYSSITVGKNDLWIAATAHITNSKLVTTDGDFDHLDGVFIDLIKPKI